MKKPDAKAESTDLVAADIEAPVLAADIEAPVDRSEGHWERTPDGECMWVCSELQESQMVAAANAGQSVQQSRDAGKLLTPSVQGWTKLDVAKFVEEVWETEEDRTKAKNYAANMQAQDIDGEGTCELQCGQKFARLL